MADSLAAPDAAIAGALGSRVIGRTRVARGGYSPAERWRVQLQDGRSAFAKVAVSEPTAAWLRQEQRVYEALAAPFMPELLGWLDGERPILLLQDLSDHFWPPPWTGERIGAVMATLDEVAATPCPPWLPRTSDSELLDTGWAEVARDPGPLLGTGLVTEGWLEQALPKLVAASEACELDRGELAHFDVRSDNLCFSADGVVLVDWNFAQCGSSRLDRAAWLPSLALEGGPDPDGLLPGAANEAAVVSGFFAARCGLPSVPEAPRVRSFQLAQARIALPWACRELEIPPPPGG